ncbi:MAG: hypothetical protein WBK53_07930 [Halanaerobiales bacterium]
MTILRKELKLIYGNKVFILMKVFFSLVYCAVGFLTKVLYEELGSDPGIVFYFIFVYPLSLTLLMLNLYPIAQEITEQVNGGIENILATGYSLKKLLMAKSLALFLPIYTPAALMLLIIIGWSKYYLAGFLSLILLLPLLIGSIAVNYISGILLTPNPGLLRSKISFSAVLVIFVLTYGPVLFYQVFGYSLDRAVSIVIAILLSLLAVFQAYRKINKISIEEIIMGAVYS